MATLHAPAGLSGDDRLLLAVIASFADPDGTNAWPNLSTLKAHTGQSLGAIRNRLVRLEDAGAINVTPGTQHSPNTYTLTVGPWRSRWLDVEDRPSARQTARARYRARNRAFEDRLSARGVEDQRARHRAQTIQTIPLDNSVVELEVSREAQPVDILGRSDPVPFEQTTTNLTGITLAKLRLHPEAVTALVQLVAVTLSGLSPPESGEVPAHLDWSTNKAGPADRRRRRERASA
jgi:hypothetical protein